MTKQFLLKQIKSNFPDLIFKKSEMITHGWHKNVIILDNKIVFTFPKTKEAKAKFRWELKTLPQLSQNTTLLIPNFKYVPKNKSFAGYDMVPGTPLTLNKFKKLTSEQKNIIAKQLSDFLNEIHSFPITIAKKNGVPMAWSEKDAKEYCLNQTKTVYKKLSNKDQAIIVNALKTYCHTENNIKKLFVHQDLTSDHILFNNKTKKLSGIIDFGDMQIADPAVDFSKLWEYEESFVDRTLKGYDSSDKSLKTRSFRWYIYQCIGNMYCGITMKRKDYRQKGYSLIGYLKK